MKISAIVAAYNESPTVLKACIEALLDQSIPLEIIVVDDGSTNLEELLPIYKWAVERGAICLQANHGGKLAAISIGLEAAISEYVLLVDSDTVLDHESASELRKKIDFGFSLACGNVRPASTHPFVQLCASIIFHLCNRVRRIEMEKARVTCCLGACRMALHPHLQALLPWVQSDAGEDHDLSLLFLQAGMKTGYVHSATAVTQAPATWKEFRRQSLRWQRSYWRLQKRTWEALKNAPLAKSCMLLRLSTYALPWRWKAIATADVTTWETRQRRTP